MQEAVASPPQQQQQEVQQHQALHSSLKRPADPADAPQQQQQQVEDLGDDTAAAGDVPVNKRQKADACAAAAAVVVAAEQEGSTSLPAAHAPAPAAAAAAPHVGVDRSHLRKHHALDADADVDGVPGQAPSEQAEQHAQHQADPQLPHAQGEEQRSRPAHHHKHKRSSKQGGKQHLLSFEGAEDGEQLDAAAAAAAEVAAAGSADAAAGSGSGGQQQAGGMGQATAAKFKAEARQAAAARFTFRPSQAAAQQQPQQQQQPGIGIVDEDDSLLKHQAPAGLSHVYFGMAQARGARPYMEDRHCIVTALKPSTAAAASAGPSALQGSSSLAFVESISNPQPLPEQAQQPAVTSTVQDGVERCYAAIFDGHNGAGAAETAARQLHLLLAGHPALKIFKGEPGPPAVVKQEEAAVGKALKSAFRQVDDLVLAVARRDGTRDGATALVVLRLGGVLYAAHAGDSRAVLCRDGQAYRLTEDHKPHLPQERQRIEEAGGRVDFQRCWRVVVEPRDGRPGSGLAVSRSLGDLDFKEPARFVECEPDVTRLALQPHKDSFVILGSDGLWDVLSDEDAVATAAAALKAYSQEHKRSSTHSLAAAAAVETATQLYKQHNSFPASTSGGSTAGHEGAELADSLVHSDGAATAAAEALLAESMRRGTLDNVTVIVMGFAW